MFRRGKPVSPRKTRSATATSDVHSQPALNDEQTDTVKILLGDTDLALEEDSGPGCDPHDRTPRHTVKHRRSKS